MARRKCRLHGNRYSATRRHHFVGAGSCGVLASGDLALGSGPVIVNDRWWAGSIDLATEALRGVLCSDRANLFAPALRSRRRMRRRHPAAMASLDASASALGSLLLIPKAGDLRQLMAYHNASRWRAFLSHLLLGHRRDDLVVHRNRCHIWAPCRSRSRSARTPPPRGLPHI